MKLFSKKEDKNAEKAEIQHILEHPDDVREWTDKKSSWYLIYCIFIAVISSFNYGYNIGMYNTSWKVIQEFCKEVYLERNGIEMKDSDFTNIISMINGLLPMGGIIGSLFSGILADYFGRKNGLWLSNFLIIISSILGGSSSYLRSYETLMISRILAGVYSGITTGVLPLYLNELPPQHLRGRIGTLNQLTIFLGLLTANIFGLPEMLGNFNNWTVLVSMNIPFSIIQLFGFCFAVESPKFLYNTKRIDESISAIEALRGKKNVNLIKLEIEELIDMTTEMDNKPKTEWIDFIRENTLRWPLLISIFIKISQFLSGINAVSFYSTEIFYSAGLSGNAPTYATILLGVIQLIMTILCMVIIERSGRRVLIVVSCIGMSFFAFALALSRINSNDERQWLFSVTVTAAIGYLIFYAIGLGPVSWIIVAELFEPAASGKANSIVSFFSWTSNFFTTVTFPYLEALIGSYSFFVYGSLLIFIAMFIQLIVPETKNRSAKQIVSSFESVSSFRELILK